MMSSKKGFVEPMIIIVITIIVTIVFIVIVFGTTSRLPFAEALKNIFSGV